MKPTINISFSSFRYDILAENQLGSGPDLNLDGGGGGGGTVGHHHSRDSAIDTELHEVEMETVEVELVCWVI